MSPWASASLQGAVICHNAFLCSCSNSTELLYFIPRHSSHFNCKQTINAVRIFSRMKCRGLIHTMMEEIASLINATSTFLFPEWFICGLGIRLRVWPLVMSQAHKIFSSNPKVSCFWFYESKSYSTGRWSSVVEHLTRTHKVLCTNKQEQKSQNYSEEEKKRF